MGGVRTVIAFLLLFSIALTSGLARAEPSGAEAEIRAFLTKHAQAFKARDIDGIMALWAAGPDIVLMGTGPGERYVGRKEVREAHLEFFKMFDAEDNRITWTKVGSDGNMAWIMAMAQVSSYYKNIRNEFAVNWSAVLKKQDGEWRFVTRHFSILTDGE